MTGTHEATRPLSVQDLLHLSDRLFALPAVSASEDSAGGRQIRTQKGNCDSEDIEKSPGAEMEDEVANGKPRGKWEADDVLDVLTGRVDFSLVTTDSTTKGHTHEEESASTWGPQKFVVNVSCRALSNPEAETPPATLAFLNQNLRACLTWLRDEHFFDVAPNSGQKPAQTQFAATLALHPPVYTCEQAVKLSPPLHPPKTAEMKNLFLKDKKKNLFLVSAVVSTKVELKKLKLPKAASGGLGFASADVLREALNLVPGSVTPFGLLFNRGHLRRASAEGEEEQGDSSSSSPAKPVAYFLDRNVEKYDRVAFHPCACNATLALSVADFHRFVRTCTGEATQMLALEESM